MNIRNAISIFFVLALCLSGCSLLPKKTTTEHPTESYADPDKYLSEYQDHLQYQHLTEDEQRGYGLLYTSVRDAGETDALVQDEDGNDYPGVRVLLDVPLTQESMSRLYESFLRDNPQFFFLDRTYSLEGHRQDQEVVYDTLLLRFTRDLASRQAAIHQLNTAIEEVLSTLPDTTDDYIIEQHFHDYLLAHCTYDEAAAAGNSSSHEDAYSAYGALVQGRAVCEGYAKAMQLLLHQAAIPATVVMGTAVEDSEAHMWNLVCINGAYYYLDVTWDDNNDAPQYTYFNITSADLSRSHLLDEEQLFNTECTDTADNYFVRNGLYLDTYERDEIAETIAKQVKDGNDIVRLRFAPGKYENALLFLKNMQLAQRMINNHLGNRASMWDYSLSTQAKQNVIMLVKSQ